MISLGVQRDIVDFARGSVARSIGVKLKFHGTDTDLSGARGSRPTAARAAARSARHEPDTCPRTFVRLLSDTRAFPREHVRWGCARVHVYASGVSALADILVVDSCKSRLYLCLSVPASHSLSCCILYFYWQINLI